MISVLGLFLLIFLGFVAYWAADHLNNNNDID